MTTTEQTVWQEYDAAVAATDAALVRLGAALGVSSS